MTGLESFCGVRKHIAHGSLRSGSLNYYCEAHLQCCCLILKTLVVFKSPAASTSTSVRALGGGGSTLRVDDFAEVTAVAIDQPPSGAIEA